MKSPFDLSGRKAVVTGGSRGIGGAIAELFLEHGAEVAICHLGDEANASALRERMAARGTRSIAPNAMSPAPLRSTGSPNGPRSGSARSTSSSIPRASAAATGPSSRPTSATGI